TGSATSAVTSTEISAAKQVTRTARVVRPDRTRRRSGIGGVANPADGTDDRAVPTELRPYLGDVHVHGTGTGVRGVPPHRGEQLLPGEHPSGPGQQVGEQVELGRREVDRYPAGVYRVPGRVEHHRAGRAYPLAFRRSGGAPQHR